MLGDDLGELLGHRIPGDHSRPVLADHYAARLRPRAGDRPRLRGRRLGRLFRSVHPEVSWVGADIDESPEVAARTRTDAEFVTFDGRPLPFEDASFELVYCKQVLEHVEHPRELMARWLACSSRAATCGLHLAARGVPLAQHLQLDALRLHARR